MFDEHERGYSYFNPDVGIEWARQHPVKSGEVPDATEVKAMTYGEWCKRFPIEKGGD